MLHCFFLTALVPQCCEERWLKTPDACDDGNANRPLSLLSSKSEQLWSISSVCQRDTAFSWALLCCKIRPAAAGAGCPSGGAGRKLRVRKAGRAPQQGAAPPYLGEGTVGSHLPAFSWEAGECPRGPDPCLAGRRQRATRNVWGAREGRRVESPNPRWWVTSLQLHTLHKKNPRLSDLVLCAVIILYNVPCLMPSLEKWRHSIELTEGEIPEQFYYLFIMHRSAFLLFMLLGSWGRVPPNPS